MTQTCPVCNLQLEALTESECDEHVNSCLDTQSAARAFACPICGRDLTAFDFLVRTVHTDSCAAKPVLPGRSLASSSSSSSYASSLSMDDDDFAAPAPKHRKGGAVPSVHPQLQLKSLPSKAGKPVAANEPRGSSKPIVAPPKIAPTRKDAQKSGAASAAVFRGKSEAAAASATCIDNGVLPMDAEMQLNIDAFSQSNESDINRSSLLRAANAVCFLCDASLASLDLSKRVAHFRDCARAKGASAHAVAEALGILPVGHKAAPVASLTASSSGATREPVALPSFASAVVLAKSRRLVLQPPATARPSHVSPRVLHSLADTSSLHGALRQRGVLVLQPPWSQRFAFRRSVVTPNSRHSRIERVFKTVHRHGHSDSAADAGAAPAFVAYQNTASFYWRSQHSTPFSYATYHASLVTRAITVDRTSLELGTQSSSSSPSSAASLWSLGAVAPITTAPAATASGTAQSEIASNERALDSASGSAVNDAESSSDDENAANEVDHASMADADYGWLSQLKGHGLSQFEFNASTQL
jgi:hypothetical protein